MPGPAPIDSRSADPPYIGRPLRRREDVRFVRGMGRYVDDVALPGMAWCAFVRSPHAHARIISLATERAAAQPGVLRVLTAADWAAAGHGELTVVHPMPFGDGRAMNCAPRPAFARAKVCHVGDIVAAVVAESRLAAEDGAEAVEVQYESLPAVVGCRDAVAPGAPLVHPQFGSNLVFDIERGDRDKTAAAMAAAAHVVELALENNRLSANPMEPRCYLCDYDAAADRYTLYATSQQPHYLRRWLSIYTLHIPEHKLRVISPDVGGGFGVKGNFAVEVSTVVWAAQLLRRPVKWTATRSETFLSDAQARDHDTIARMGFDRRRPHRGDADRYGGCARRLSQQLRAQHSRQLISADRHRALSHAQPASAGARGLYQHRSGRCLSRLRPSGGDLDQRAAPGARRARARPRRRGDAPAQSHHARRFSLCGAGRARLRLRRSAGAAREAARARRLSGASPRADADAQSRRAHGDRARGVRRQGRHRSERQSRQARRPARRLGERDRARAQRRQGHGARRQPFPRPGARHHVLSDRRRSPRARHRRHRVGRGRYRSRALRQRYLGSTLDVGGGHRDLSGLRQGPRQGAAARRASVGMRRGRPRLPRRQLHRARHRPCDRVRRGCRPRLSRRAAAAGGACPAWR